MGWIKWSRWQNGIGRVDSGIMPLDRVMKELQRHEMAAKDLLDSTGTDHVLYGMKMYGQDDRLEAVHFYLWPMSDEEFEKATSKLRNSLVYALHKR